jgi:hypothetical protein
VAPFWQAASDLDLGVPDEAALAGAREGHLAELFEAAGLRQVEQSVLVARVEYGRFDDWWETFELGVGPAGAQLVALPPDQRVRLRDRCRALMPPAPFEVVSFAWAARGNV